MNSGLDHKKQKIYVAGHRGMVGSAIVRMLILSTLGKIMSYWWYSGLVNEQYVLFDLCISASMSLLFK